MTKKIKSHITIYELNNGNREIVSSATENGHNKHISLTVSPDNLIIERYTKCYDVEERIKNKYENGKISSSFIFIKSNNIESGTCTIIEDKFSVSLIDKLGTKVFYTYEPTDRGPIISLKIQSNNEEDKNIMYLLNNEGDILNICANRYEFDLIKNISLHENPIVKVFLDMGRQYIDKCADIRMKTNYDLNINNLI